MSTEGDVTARGSRGEFVPRCGPRCWPSLVFVTFPDFQFNQRGPQGGVSHDE